MSVLAAALQLILLGGLLISVAIVWWLDRPDGDWIGRLRRRLLLGVPWGTLVSVSLVMGVYLGLQHGYTSWAAPLTVPYVSWSYLYPLGMVTAAFAHTGPSHLLGNLIGTIVLAPIVEYAWSHYPRQRGTTSFASVWHNPYVRAFVLFPLGVIVVGVATAVFHWGPLIGFSGVVYAFAGFALVQYPIVTVVALGGRGVISTAYDALVNPVVSAAPGPSFGGPWWAGIAIEGHIFGLVVGAILGTQLHRLRPTDRRPSALRLWVGTVIAATSLTVWAIWWYGEGPAFVLYRGPGLVMVVVFAILFTAATVASNRDLLPERLGAPDRQIGVGRRSAAVMVLVMAVSTMAVVAVPVNMTMVESASVPDDSVDVREYEVFYAEEVQNQNVPAVDFPVVDGSTTVTTSGVIVVNERRHIWTREVSKGALAFFGYARVTVGGPTWEHTVAVQREGWVPAGAGAVYQVWVQAPDGDWRHAFASDPQTADPVIANRSVSIAAAAGSFTVLVSRDESVIDRAPIPPQNESVRVGGLRLVHDGSALIAVHDGTRIVVASEESYA